MKNNSVLFVVFIILMQIGFNVYADPIPKALPPINAFSAGIGCTGVAVPNNPATLYWNPGGLGLMKQLAVDFTVVVPTLEGPGSWAFLMANSVSDQGERFGFGLIRRHARWDEESTFKSFTVMLPLSHSFKSGNIPIGVTLKMISEKFDNGDWHYGLTLDTGTLWRSRNGIHLGFSSLNIAGSDLRAFKLESWFGASWHTDKQPITLAMQIRVDRPFDWSYINRHYNIGIDYAIFSSRMYLSGKANTYKIRGGYLHDDENAWFSAGFEVKFANSNNHTAYTMVVNPDGWEDRAHFLSYGYSVKSIGKPTPNTGIR